MRLNNYQKKTEVMNLSKEEKLLDTIKILSELHAISISKYIIPHLTETNSIYNNKLKTCQYGLGVQKTDA